jgi:hypothetical protein
MQEVKFQYVSDEIEFLFKRELQVLDNIKQFCKETNKGVEINYSLFTDDNNFMLEIIVTDEGKSNNN